MHYLYIGEGPEPDLLVDTPPVPPRRRDRKRNSPPKPISNGLPPTPKVHMGACFSKVNIIIIMDFLKFVLNTIFQYSFINIRVGL